MEVEDVEEVEKQDGARNRHTLKTNFYRKFCSPKYAYLIRSILNSDFHNRQSQEDDLNDTLLEYFDDGMHCEMTEDQEDLQDFAFQFHTLRSRATDYVMYSLNKRKRWEIPEKVEQVLYQLADEDFRVTVYERQRPTGRVNLNKRLDIWSDCLGCMDSKGTVIKRLKPKHKSHITDLRRICTEAVPPQRTKQAWKYHNQHWRDLQRKQEVCKRNGDRNNPKAQFTSLSLFSGNDNEAGCPELRYDIIHPDKVHPRLKELHRFGSYSMYERIPDYVWYKWDKGRQKALKKTKGRRNNSKSWKFMGSFSHKSIQDDIDCYHSLQDPTYLYDEEMETDLRSKVDRRTKMDCTCGRGGLDNLDWCCCNCGWSVGDDCSCFGYYCYGDAYGDNICSCHSNQSRISGNNHRSVSLELDFSSLPIKSKKTKKRATKQVTHQSQSKTHPNRLMSGQVTMYYGKGETIYFPDLVNKNDKEAETRSENSETEYDSGVSSTKEEDKFESHDIKLFYVTCNIKRSDVSEFMKMQDAKVGQSVPPRYCLQLHGQDDDDDVSLIVSEKLTSHVEQSDIGEYSIRIHTEGDRETLQTGMNALYTKIHVEDLLVLSMEEVVELAKKSMTEARRNSCWGRQKPPERAGSRKGKHDGYHCDLTATLKRHSTTTEIRTVQEAFKLLSNKEDHTVHIGQGEAGDDVTSNGTNFDGMVCSVCVSPVDSDTEGTVLLPCQHFFCNKCLTHYIVDRIGNGVKKIECLEYKCSNVVDLTTVMSLISSHIFNRWRQRCAENAVEASGIWKWCPNNNCGKVASLHTTGSTSDITSVRCDCATLWCIHCHQEAHWPATCNQAETYTKLLKQNGDFDGADDVRTVYVKVKKCPSCKYPMEKNGGCSHMMCSKCGASFCWECLRNWSDHYQAGWNMSCAKKVDETVVELSNKRVFSLPIQYYIHSVRNRKKQLRLCDAFLWREASTIVSRFQLRERVYGPTGWRYVWSEELQYRSEELCQSVIQQLVYIRECHRLVEKVYIVVSHSTRKMKEALTIHSLAEKIEFILQQIEKLTRTSISPEDLERRDKLRQILDGHLKLIIGLSIHLQNRICKKKFTPPMLKNPKLDPVRFK